MQRKLNLLQVALVVTTVLGFVNGQTTLEITTIEEEEGKITNYI